MSNSESYLYCPYNANPHDTFAPAQPMSLEEFMVECVDGDNNLWNELINWQDEYTDIDLAIIEDIINGHVNVQLGMDFAEQIEGKKLTMEKND